MKSIALLSLLILASGCGGSSTKLLSTKTSAEAPPAAESKPAAPEAISSGCPLFPDGDQWISDSQGDFKCVVDTTLGEAACSLAGSDFQLVEGLSHAAQLPTGDEEHFCAETDTGDTYCWGHDLIAHLQ